MAMVKINIINRISEEIGLSNKECSTIVDSLFEIMKDELAKGNPVKISKFGKWTVANKHARRGRNPQTGEDITINARKVVTFRASTAVRNSINSDNQ